MGSTNRSCRKLATDNDPSDCRIGSLQVVFGVASEEVGANKSVMNAHARNYPVSDKRFRPPSAYKHGGFSKTVLFPWEDADEFDALHRSLQDEWDRSQIG